MDESLYIKAVKYLTRRPRSEKELRDYLAKKTNSQLHHAHKKRNTWHISQGEEIDTQDSQRQIDMVIAKLQEQRFLNDKDFAVWWVEQRTRFKAKGWSAIVFELKQKGISEEFISSLGLEMEEERDEKELAFALVTKRMKKYQGMPKDELYRKLGSFLARRGFGMEVIRACIDEVLRKSV